MKIVCDKNMPYAGEAFSTLGETTLKDGRLIVAADVRDAEMLITRSTTKVNASLLQGSRVRFYGSGVIGTDHIDIPWLTANGITWSAAPGCNAESVANYITAALLWLGGEHNFTLRGKTLGVIGVGNVGRAVCRHACALGMRVLANDPPRQRDATDSAAQSFVPLEQLLSESDVVTCHVPLTKGGTDPTWHLLGAKELALMRCGTILINAARGAVLDTDALLVALDDNIAHSVIDCWEGEPTLRMDLLKRAAITTPHIAGHSYEGKVNGTAIVYRKACDFLGVAPRYNFDLPLPPVPWLKPQVEGRATEDVLRELVLGVYGITADSQRLAAACLAASEQRAANFDAQRSHYPMRREFSATRVTLTDAAAPLRKAVAALGFQLDPT